MMTDKLQFRIKYWYEFGRIISTTLLLFLLLLPGDTVWSQTEVVRAFPNLSFELPLDLQGPGDGSGRLFVVEQAGRIWGFRNDSTVMEKKLFLDIRDRVDDRESEEGLLGLAFHPEYEKNGYFFVDYTAADPPRTIIARYRVSESDPWAAVPGSEQVILEVDQPYNNHNGGQIAFGPDGYLYVAFGDGGSGGDPDENGQDRSTLLGSIIRIDVDTSTAGRNYGIPPDNPFAGNSMGYREEIYAYGLRNPWRFSFDSGTGRLWTGDVGQNKWEEIDIIRSGENYGWDRMEGFHCYEPSECDTTGLTLPVWEYGHTLGESVTGGFVYRGNRVPGLQGKYVYGDFVSGRIWALEYTEGKEPKNSLVVNTDLNISSFGVDSSEELYICAFNGNIYRFADQRTSVRDERRSEPGQVRLYQNSPNPFNGETELRYHLSQSTPVHLAVYDVSGREVITLTDRYQEPGSYEVGWRGENEEREQVNSGVYFIRLQTVTATRTVRAIYLK